MMREAGADIGRGGVVDNPGEERESIGQVLPRGVCAGHVVVVCSLDEKRGRQHVAMQADRIKDHIRGGVPGKPEHTGKLHQPDIGDIGHGLVRGRLAGGRRLDL